MTLLKFYSASGTRFSKKEATVNKEKSSKTYIASKTDKIEGTSNENSLKHYFNAAYGDLNVLDYSETVIYPQTGYSIERSNATPNSRGDYCQNKHKIEIENNKRHLYSSESNVLRDFHEQYSKAIENNEHNNVSSLKRMVFQKHIHAVETLDQIMKVEHLPVSSEATRKICSTFEFGNTYKVQDNVPLTETTKSYGKKEDLAKSKEDKVKKISHKSAENEVTKDFPERVHKIIKRVEDIYTQLEDISLAVSFLKYLITVDSKMSNCFTQEKLI